MIELQKVVCVLSGREWSGVLVAFPWVLDDSAMFLPDSVEFPGYLSSGEAVSVPGLRGGVATLLRREMLPKWKALIDALVGESTESQVAVLADLIRSYSTLHETPETRLIAATCVKTLENLPSRATALLDRVAKLEEVARAARALELEHRKGGAHESSDSMWLYDVREALDALYSLDEEKVEGGTDG